MMAPSRAIPPFPSGRYGAILADPPWHFYNRSPKGEGRNATRHYRTMTVADLAALPVPFLAADDCALFLWVTDPLLPVGLEIMRAWGFAYKTVAFHWVKTRQDSMFYVERDLPMGLGYWTRANPELCLLGTHGRPKRRDMGVRRLVMYPRREHSRKPDSIYAGIERLVAGPYVELFARATNTRPQWTSWGNEVGKFTDVG